jgi:hypothetical protein
VRALGTHEGEPSMAKNRSGTMALVAFVALLLVASSAGAARFKMSGTWTQNRGPNVDIPVNPGFIPGNGRVTAVANAAGQPFTLPTGQFKEKGGGAVFPLFGTTLVQLTTMLDALGPDADAMFFAGPKTTRPMSFMFCPGSMIGQGTPANPNCQTGSPQPTGTGGLLPGLTSYTAGPNQFGGTARMLLSGGGSVGVKVGNTPMGAFLVLHNPFGGDGGYNPQGPGGTYADTETVVLMPGNITVQGADPAGMVITMPGPIVAMGPSEINLTTGFPWTTGTVTVSNPTATMIAPPSGSMLSIMGMDTVMGGNRNITMVSSAITRRSLTALNTFVSIDVISLQIGEELSVPSLTAGSYAAGATLLVLAAGYFLRRRLA